MEPALNDFNPRVREEALRALVARRSEPPATRPLVNLHAHTFYSYNPYGYSPSAYAWRAGEEGLEVAGIVDFDVLDGLDEFLHAGELLGLKSVVSIESRVFVPEFADRVINSPGEPGIAYHMGVGFTNAAPSGEAGRFLADMRRRAEQRTRDMLRRVNAHNAPVVLDYAQDVLPLTPNGNVTERHLCRAYALKAAELFPDPGQLAAYWARTLGDLPPGTALPTSPELEALIRAKTMKRGGVGYVAPDAGSFPNMADMNSFVLEAGAIPTLAWLDGTSEGERDMEALLRVARASGTAAINIIPDRNFTPGVRDEKLQNLYDVVALAEQHDLPIVVGTEMNSPGQKFVDDFASAELAPLLPAFLKGAHIVYGHTVLQKRAGLGYTSTWAQRHFANPADRNAFYEEIGRLHQPGQDSPPENLSESDTPDDIRAMMRSEHA